MLMGNLVMVAMGMIMPVIVGVGVRMIVGVSSTLVGAIDPGKMNDIARFSQ